MNKFIRFFDLIKFFNFFKFWNLDKFEYKILDILLFIILSFLAIFIDTNRFFDELFTILSIKVNRLAILLKSQISYQ